MFTGKTTKKHPLVSTGIEIGRHAQQISTEFEIKEFFVLLNKAINLILRN